MMPPGKGPSRRCRAAVAALAWAVLSSCTTLQAPVVPPDTASLPARVASGGGLRVSAWPLVDPAVYAENFDEYLPAAGIAALWVEVSAAEGTDASVPPLRWSLRTPMGKKSALQLRDLLDRYYERRGIRMYSVKVDSEAENRLRAIAVPLQHPPAGRGVRGYLFFPIDPPAAASWTEGSSLVVAAAGQRTPVELRLADAGR